MTTLSDNALFASTDLLRKDATGTHDITTIQPNISHYPPLEEIERDYFIENNVPVITVLGLLSVIGVIGNIHSLIVYATSPAMKERAVRLFIIWLSATDLTACSLLIPFEIIEMRKQYTFTSDETCKFFRYLGHVVSFSSCCFLMAIAVERFWILRKNRPQVSVKPTRVLNCVSGAIIVLALLVSIPFLIYFGVDEINVPGYPLLTGHECSAKLDDDESGLIVAYAATMAVFSLIFFLIIAALYGKILFDFHRTKSECGEARTDKYNKARELTITLIIATAVSSSGYLVYIGTGLAIFVVNPELYNTSYAPLYDFLLRSYLWNNVANPVIYFIKDDKFRSECISLYRKCYGKIQ